MLPDGASIINFSRGGVVVTSDLLSSLGSNKLYHSVLGVFEREPLPVESELWNNSKVTVLPHVAATTNTTTAIKIIAGNIRKFRESSTLDSFINLDKGY